MELTNTVKDYELHSLKDLSLLLNIKYERLYSMVRRKKIKPKEREFVKYNYQNLYDFQDIKKGLKPDVIIVDRTVKIETLKVEKETYHIYESKMNYLTEL